MCSRLLKLRFLCHWLKQIAKIMSVEQVSWTLPPSAIGQPNRLAELMVLFLVRMLKPTDYCLKGLIWINNFWVYWLWRTILLQNRVKNNECFLTIPIVTVQYVLTVWRIVFYGTQKKIFWRIILFLTQKTLIIFKISAFVFFRRRKCIQVWNNMRVSKRLLKITISLKEENKIAK